MKWQCNRQPTLQSILLSGLLILQRANKLQLTVEVGGRLVVKLFDQKIFWHYPEARCRYWRSAASSCLIEIQLIRALGLVSWLSWWFSHWVNGSDSTIYNVMDGLVASPGKELSSQHWDATFNYLEARDLAPDCKHHIKQLLLKTFWHLNLLSLLTRNEEHQFAKSVGGLQHF